MKVYIKLRKSLLVSVIRLCNPIVVTEHHRFSSLSYQMCEINSINTNILKSNQTTSSSPYISGDIAL